MSSKVSEGSLRPSELLLIFDLDGTLIDSREDLAISTNATRAYFGLPPLSDDVVQSYVGNGASVLVRKALGPGVTDAQAHEGLAFFLKYYRAHSLQHTRLYDGVAEAVSTLAGQGHDLSVLTNKPRQISLDIIDALGLAASFFQIYGGDSFPEKEAGPGRHRQAAERTTRRGRRHLDDWR